MTRSILLSLVAAVTLSTLASGFASGQNGFQVLSAGRDGSSSVSRATADNLKAPTKRRAYFNPKELTIDKHVPWRK